MRMHKEYEFYIEDKEFCFAEIWEQIEGQVFLPLSHASPTPESLRFPVHVLPHSVTITMMPNESPAEGNYAIIQLNPPGFISLQLGGDSWQAFHQVILDAFQSEKLELFCESEEIWRM